MDEQGTQSWISNVWNKRPGAMQSKRSLLVWDMFKAHLTDGCKKTAVALKTDLAVIPGGLTYICITLHVHQRLKIPPNAPFSRQVK